MAAMDSARLVNVTSLLTTDLLSWTAKLDLLMERFRRRVDATIKDPEKAERLKAYYRFLCKRPCFHDEYLATFNRPNVTLVDCPGGVEEVTETGVIVDGQEYELDCIIYATGFEAEVTPVKGTRRVRWGDDYADTDLYELTDVEAGSSITGPAIVESVATTFAIPPGREARLDRHHIFHLSAALE